MLPCGFLLFIGGGLAVS